MAVLVSGFSLTAAGCAGAGQKMLAIIEGPLNDPSNKSLRRSIMGYGLKEFCHQMTVHNAPLKLNEDSPVMGRFFPTSCAQRETPDGNLYVTFSGTGYAWTNVTKKLSFTSNGAVEYDQDFRMDGSTMYAYFQTKKLGASDFDVRIIEQPVANLLNQMNPVADTFGRQLSSTMLSQGFTVIREANGTADFSVGHVERGKRPVHPYDVRGEGRITYENLRTEVHQNQRDFIGPIEVEDSGRALYFEGTVDGGQPVDVLFLGQKDGEASLKLYLDYPMSGPLSGNVIAGDVMRPGAPFKKVVPVPKGIYFIVLDNTPTAGQVAPPMNPLDDRAAAVSYVAQIGEVP
ncbi:hypothetical protein [Pendulispora albinea]|uniref:Uncharacterized protein n=1 Tax=Pendulispora albinea TaxID=2741071 RepID=A0ABZ2LTC7_9BACT